MVKKYLNRPQMRSLLIGAPFEMAILGRGTGKTTNILAPKSMHCYVKEMPRSTGTMIARTYNQILTRTLPELVRGWQDYGYEMDKHFLVCKTPTADWKRKWDWHPPFSPTFDYKYSVQFWNGTQMRFISQDRPGSSNGMSIDWTIGDEGKLIDEEKYKTEFLPANRGYVQSFSATPYHHGITLTTDMPVGQAGRWLFDFEKAMDSEAINMIWAIQCQLFTLKRKLGDAAYNLDLNCRNLEKSLVALRRNLVYYHEASTLENIFALGVDYFKQQMRDSSTFQFSTQILNIKPKKVEDGFYPDFNENYHGYFANDNTYLDRMGFDLSLIGQINCLRDTDVDLEEPLHIALDYNRRIWPLEVFQINESQKELRQIKSMHSLYPGKIRDVIADFGKYYAPMRNKVVYYWYDHTAVGKMNDTSFSEDVVTELRKAGFIVIEKYFGKAPNHSTKYDMWGKLLRETGEYPYKFRINRENAAFNINSMNNAPAITGKDGFEKDKRSERRQNVPAEEATHHSDAGDMVVFGILLSNESFIHSISQGGGGWIH